MMADYPAHIEALRLDALRTTVEAYALRARLPLSRGVERFGACPRCGGKDRFSLNAHKNVWNCRGCGKGGHDSIGLAMHVHGFTFIQAIEAITGRKADDLKSESAEQKQMREKQILADREKAEKAQQKREHEAESYRNWARNRGYKIWESGHDWQECQIVEQYLAMRGLDISFLSDKVKNLRGINDHPYVKKIGGKNHVLHTGPAMLARVHLPGGKFGAVHQTWIDLEHPSGKAQILHPNTGEKLNSKTLCGSQKGGAILLFTPPGATRLVVGEGIETTLSVMTSNFEPYTAYWCLVNLGNMAGRAARNGAGKIINDQPDMDDKDAFVPPAWVKEMVFLGDADAKTEAKYQKTKGDLLRGCKRAMINRPGLQTSIAMAERGKDFNDMIQSEATNGGLNTKEKINAE